MKRDWRQIEWGSETIAATRRLMQMAKEEDLSSLGDLTTLATVPETSIGSVQYRVRKSGVVAGIKTLAIAAEVYDSHLSVTTAVKDGDAVNAGALLATLTGPARSILAVERPSLNLFSRMCGIASATRMRVDRIAGTHCRLYDTRKTTPGLRWLEKFAVRCGGGRNHRTGLYDGILIKDNHLALAGVDGRGQAPSVAVKNAQAWRRSASEIHRETLLIEVEVDSWEQFIEVLPAGPDIVLLDNLGASRLRDAVAYRNAHAPEVELEASGGINDETLLDLAMTGIDRLSMGALTHSAVQLDIGLDWIE